VNPRSAHLLFHCLPHALSDYGRIVVDRERHCALKSVRTAFSGNTASLWSADHREWIALNGHSDRINYADVGAAIAAIHREPARRWTVATLAIEVGMSRSGFAARFGQLVGDGPIEYLTRWRMLLAGRSLSRGERIGAIALSPGYESESAFSTAFKRVMGITPRYHARLAAVAIAS